jgi:hypothetical protein
MEEVFRFFFMTADRHSSPSPAPPLRHTPTPTITTTLIHSPHSGVTFRPVDQPRKHCLHYFARQLFRLSPPPNPIPAIPLLLFSFVFNFVLGIECTATATTATATTATAAIATNVIGIAIKEQ